jgi:hypothetical protein
MDRFVKPPTRMAPNGEGTRVARGESMLSSAGLAITVHRGTGLLECAAGAFSEQIIPHALQTHDSQELESA